MPDADGGHYRFKQSTITVPGFSYQVEGRGWRSYRKSLEIVNWHLVKVEAEMEKTGSGSFLSPDASAGIGFGTNFGGAFSTIGSQLIPEMSKNLRAIGKITGYGGLALSGFNVTNKIINGEIQPSDWADLLITGGLVVGGALLTASGVGILAVTLGGTIYSAVRLGCGTEIDMWINNRFK
jgi:hypothetical protein